jgi:hypothetical protein
VVKVTLEGVTVIAGGVRVTVAEPLKEGLELLVAVTITTSV